jgi:UDPglucose 6-dehydrogenase
VRFPFAGRNGGMSVAVVGSGVVGTATGAGLRAVGHRVVFCDVDPARVRLLRARGFDALDCLAMAEEQLDVDAYLVSVPTPTVLGQVDLSYVEDAAAAVGRAVGRNRGWPVVVVRSTVPPGTTEDVVVPVLEASSGRLAGPDFGVCANPEFLRAATAEADFMDPRVIAIGSLDERSELALRRLYAPWPDVPVVATDLRTAEALKYVSNLYNATKISFFNEMHRLLGAMGADPDVAARAVALGAEGMWNPSYGTRGGAPFGGVCLPKDTMGFLGFLEERGLAGLAPILRAAIQVNDEMSEVAAPLDAAAPPERSGEPPVERWRLAGDREATR